MSVTCLNAASHRKHSAQPAWTCWAIYSINNLISLPVNTDMCEVNKREEDKSHVTLGRMTYIIIANTTVRLVAVRV